MEMCYSQQTTCLATVKQIGNNFKTGKQPHIHDPQSGVAPSYHIYKEVKGKALSNTFESAAEIADAVISEHIDNDEPLPSPANLAKAANHHRQCHCPKDPVTLDFDVAEDFIPDGFLKKDVKAGSYNHLIFCNQQNDQTTFFGKKTGSLMLLSNPKRRGPGVRSLAKLRGGGPEVEKGRTGRTLRRLRTSLPKYFYTCART